MKNVIILTGGLAGSSVLTSLLNRAGYWVGDSTMKKHDYDTWENAELVNLNIQLLEEVGFHEKWTMTFHPDYIKRVTEPAKNLDPAPFKAFVDKCTQHQPWIWKDPRLWLTIRHWRPFLDLDNTCFLVIHREHRQAWISDTIRRQIQTPEYERRYTDGVLASIRSFLAQEQASFLEILYEDLIITPERVLDEINHLTGTALSFQDFQGVFRGRIGKKQHGLKNWLLAMAIYLKNYHERYR